MHKYRVTRTLPRATGVQSKIIQACGFELDGPWVRFYDDEDDAVYALTVCNLVEIERLAGDDKAAYLALADATG